MSLQNYTTLPGTLPLLVRGYSPLIWQKAPAVYLRGSDARVLIWSHKTRGEHRVRYASVALNLDEPTGLWHAALWYESVYQHSRTAGDLLQRWTTPEAAQEACLWLARENGWIE